MPQLLAFEIAKSIIEGLKLKSELKIFLTKAKVGTNLKPIIESKETMGCFSERFERMIGMSTIIILTLFIIASATLLA